MVIAADRLPQTTLRTPNAIQTMIIYSIVLLAILSLIFALFYQVHETELLNPVLEFSLYVAITGANYLLITNLNLFVDFPFTHLMSHPGGGLTISLALPLASYAATRTSFILHREWDILPSDTIAKSKPTKGNELDSRMETQHSLPVSNPEQEPPSSKSSIFNDEETLEQAESKPIHDSVTVIEPDNSTGNSIY